MVLVRVVWYSTRADTWLQLVDGRRIQTCNLFWETDLFSQHFVMIIFKNTAKPKAFYSELLCMPHLPSDISTPKLTLSHIYQHIYPSKYPSINPTFQSIKNFPQYSAYILLNRVHYSLIDFFLWNTVSIYKKHKSQMHIPWLLTNAHTCVIQTPVST